MNEDDNFGVGINGDFGVRLRKRAPTRRAFGPLDVGSAQPSSICAAIASSRWANMRRLGIHALLNFKRNKPNKGYNSAGARCLRANQIVVCPSRWEIQERE